jgi:hypothetical protein
MGFSIDHHTLSALMPIWRDGPIGNYVNYQDEEGFYERLDAFYFPEDTEIRKIEIFEYSGGAFNGMKFYNDQNNCIGQLCDIFNEAMYTAGKYYFQNYDNKKRVIEIQPGEKIIGCKYEYDKL